MNDDKMGGKIRRPKGRASVDDTESFLTPMHPSLAPKPGDRLTVVAIGVTLKQQCAGPAVALSLLMSVAGLRGSVGLAGHCATKKGRASLREAVAVECAAAGDGIRINAVHPGGYR